MGYFFLHHSLNQIKVEVFEQKSDIWGVIQGPKHRHTHNVILDSCDTLDIGKEMAAEMWALQERHTPLGQQLKARLTTLWHLSSTPNSSVDLGFTHWCHCSAGHSSAEPIHTNDCVCECRACKFHFLVISSQTISFSKAQLWVLAVLPDYPYFSKERSLSRAHWGK